MDTENGFKLLKDSDRNEWWDENLRNLTMLIYFEFDR